MSYPKDMASPVVEAASLRDAMASPPGGSAVGIRQPFGISNRTSQRASTVNANQSFVQALPCHSRGHRHCHETPIVAVIFAYAPHCARSIGRYPPPESLDMSSSKVPGSGPASSAFSGILIPKATRGRSEQSRRASVPRQPRAGRACLACKSRKVRCNGGQPRCSSCIEHAMSCVYPTARKDRLRLFVSFFSTLRQLFDFQQGNDAKSRDDCVVAGTPTPSP
jgi:hypothetical protein